MSANQEKDGAKRFSRGALVVFAATASPVEATLEQPKGNAINFTKAPFILDMEALRQSYPLWERENEFTRQERARIIDSFGEYLVQSADKDLRSIEAQLSLAGREGRATLESVQYSPSLHQAHCWEDEAPQGQGQGYSYLLVLLRSGGHGRQAREAMSTLTALSVNRSMARIAQTLPGPEPIEKWERGGRFVEEFILGALNLPYKAMGEERLRALQARLEAIGIAAGVPVSTPVISPGASGTGALKRL